MLAIIGVALVLGVALIIVGAAALLITARSEPSTESGSGVPDPAPAPVLTLPPADLSALDDASVAACDAAGGEIAVDARLLYCLGRTAVTVDGTVLSAPQVFAPSFARDQIVISGQSAVLALSAEDFSAIAARAEFRTTLFTAPLAGN